MYTYQDFEEASDKKAFILSAIAEHQNSEAYRIAKDADEYDKQKNVTIVNYIKTMYTMSGSPVVDFTASNAKITSNFFHRLNVQRKTYLLGNGVTFKEESTKEKLGEEFDDVLADIAYNALIHQVAFGFWNFDRLYLFKFTEFVPLFDEETSALRAGIRFWQIAPDKPLYVVLYEEDGYTKYKSRARDTHGLQEVQEKRKYVQTVNVSEAGGEEVIGEYNYSSLPIIPMWGNKRHQSTLVGAREAIDAYDLVRSGFANDLSDVAQIYWLIENASGMDDDDLARFRDRLKINHIATVTTNDGANVRPYTQDIPYLARRAFLEDMKAQIYEDFGALDVHQVNANSTNDHLESAYQPLDEEADDLEFQVTKFIQQLLALMDIEGEYPTYKRNRIANMKEQTDMVLASAQYLDEETVLNKLPFITVDEVKEIMERKDAENMERFASMMQAQEGAEAENTAESEEDEENTEEAENEATEA